MGLCHSKDKDFDAYDTDGSKLMDKEEFGKFIVKHSGGQLWQTTQLNLGLTEQEAKACAIQCAWQLAGCFDIETGVHKKGLTQAEFVKFKSNYADMQGNPQGNQKFVMHTVFSSQDTDGNGFLDAQELDGLAAKFFDGSWLSPDDPRMKKFRDKEHFKELITLNCDENKDGKFSFEEMVGVISGQANLVDKDEEEPMQAKEVVAEKIIERASSSLPKSHNSEEQGGSAAEEPVAVAT